MPERLLQAGVSWKVYNDGEGLLAFNPLPYFKPYAHLDSVEGIELAKRALTPTYPNGFASDVKSGSLPAVAWIVPPPAQCEHPASPPQNGEALVSQVLATLNSNPDVWARTVLLVIYDENGGFFDHVPPPTPPAGTDGEYLTMKPLPADAGGFAGPVGLGFRTPCLVISPFTTGGYKYSGVLDHTSVLRLIEARFGVAAPNISAWRRSVTGDFTGALQLGRAPGTTVPSLPAPKTIGNSQDIAKAVLDALSGKPASDGNTYPIPAVNARPVQDASPARPAVG
jgi:phospholipase C